MALVFYFSMKSLTVWYMGPQHGW